MNDDLRTISCVNSNEQQLPNGTDNPCEMPTLAQIIQQTAAKLKDSAISDFSMEARLLIAHAFGFGSVEMITRDSMQISKDQAGYLNGLIDRRIAGESIGRIAGKKEFYGLPFSLSEEVLEPRADTEILVDEVLNDYRMRDNRPVKILEMGTGSGAIIVSLLANIPHAQAIASDISDEALNIALKNARNNQVCDRVGFIKSDWSKGIGEFFDVIVSNPPYIRSAIVETLASEVKNHDPLLALDGGEEGLDAYQSIFTRCSSKLNKNGKLYLEIGYDQAESVVDLAHKTGWQFVRLAKDLGNNDRVVVFRR